MPRTPALTPRPGAPASERRGLPGLLACCLALVCLALACPATGAEPVTVPILDRMPGGKRIGHWIPVQAGGGEPCLALLDTGSKGLMLRVELMGPDVKRTGRRMRQAFQDGTVFEGEIVRTWLRVGSAASVEPIFALAVDKAYCRKDKPDCPAEALWRSPAGGIIGVGFAGPSSLDHPLEYFGKPRSDGFLIRGAGPDHPATLTLGIPPGGRSGFAMFAAQENTRRPGKREGFFTANSVNGCISFDDASLPRMCGRILFDTGSSMSIVRVERMPQSGALLAGGVVPPGKPFRLSIDGLPDIASTTDLAPWSDRIMLLRDGRDGIILGGGVFRRLDLLYDLNARAIGLRPAR